MSCTICGQDVPVIPTAEDAEIVTCLRCRARLPWAPPRHANLRLDRQHRASDERSTSITSRREPPPLIAEDDDWDDMYHPTESWRHDPPPSFSLTYRTDHVDSSPADPRSAEGRQPRTHWLQWMILASGAALFSGGAALVAWSFGDDHQHLWNIGAPMALAGQAAFLIGLVLQLDVIWQQSKQTHRRLDDLDQRVSPATNSDLGGAAASKGNRGAAQAPSGDAESLLSELKNQLDRMATRLARGKN